MGWAVLRLDPQDGWIRIKIQLVQSLHKLPITGKQCLSFPHEQSLCRCQLLNQLQQFFVRTEKRHAGVRVISGDQGVTHQDVQIFPADQISQFLPSGSTSASSLGPQPHQTAPSAHILQSIRQEKDLCIPAKILLLSDPSVFYRHPSAAEAAAA